MRTREPGRARTRPREFHGAVAADVLAADGGDPSRPGRDRPRRRRITHRDFLARSRRLAGPLAAHGIGGGDTVSAVLPNVPAMVEAHHGVPMLGAVR